MIGELLHIQIVGEKKLGWILKACRDGAGAYVHDVKCPLPSACLQRRMKVYVDHQKGNDSYEVVELECFKQSQYIKNRDDSSDPLSVSPVTVPHNWILNEGDDISPLSDAITIVGCVVWSIDDELMLCHGMDVIAGKLRTSPRPSYITLYRSRLVDKSACMEKSPCMNWIMEDINVIGLIDDPRMHSWLYKYIKSVSNYDTQISYGIYMAAFIHMKKWRDDLQVLDDLILLGEGRCEGYMDTISSFIYRKIVSEMEGNSYLHSKYRHREKQNYANSIQSVGIRSEHVDPNGEDGSDNGRLLIESNVRRLNEFFLNECDLITSIFESVFIHEYRRSVQCLQMSGCYFRNYAYNTSMKDVLSSDLHSYMYNIHLNRILELENNNNVHGNDRNGFGIVSIQSNVFLLNAHRVAHELRKKSDHFNQVASLFLLVVSHFCLLSFEDILIGS